MLVHRCRRGALTPRLVACLYGENIPPAFDPTRWRRHRDHAVRDRVRLLLEGILGDQRSAGCGYGAMLGRVQCRVARERSPMSPASWIGGVFCGARCGDWSPRFCIGGLVCVLIRVSVLASTPRTTSTARAWRVTAGPLRDRSRRCSDWLRHDIGCRLASPLRSGAGRAGGSSCGGRHDLAQSSAIIGHEKHEEAQRAESSFFAPSCAFCGHCVCRRAHRVRSHGLGTSTRAPLCM